MLLLMTAPSLLTAFIGGLIKLNNRVYFDVTGVFLLTAAALLASRQVLKSGEPNSLPAWAAITIGAATGFLSGLTGVGGGTYLAPILIVSGWATPKRVAAISPPFILCNSTFGLVGVLLSGQTLPSGTFTFAMAALVGAITGVKIAHYWMSEKAIKCVLIVILCGFRLLWH